MLTPAIYRTTITHDRHAPVRHSFQYRSYSWYVDIDELPMLPWWLRVFARFDPRDHLVGSPGQSLRERVDTYLAHHDAALPGGRITALLQARVLGYVFNPISVFWCHDHAGVLQHVIAEVHNTYGQRHAYLVPPSNRPQLISKKLYVSPFNGVDGHYQVLAPRPDQKLDLVVSLHDGSKPAFVARLRGTQRPATLRHIARMQVLSPLAPLVVSARIRLQGIALWLRRVPVVPRPLQIDRNACPPSDPGHSPTVPAVPSGPRAAISAIAAQRLLHRIARRSPLRFAFPDGTVIGAGDAESPVLTITEPDRLYRRIGRHGLIGFGESFMAGEWNSDRLTEVLTVLASDIANLVPPALQWLRPIVVASQPGPARPNRAEARRAVSSHYDRSNDLFSEFLDETMTYSSALFDRFPATWPDLADAQRRKIDRLLDKAGVGPGTQVLEVGTGWGELCIRAAARGAQVRSLTLSQRQAWLARQRVAAAGLSDRVQIDLRDFRDVGGNYDAVISVEMIEAIGYNAWSEYFRVLEQLLKPGGRLVIQSITMPHDRMLASRKSHTWIQKYIFPGGLIPSTKVIAETTERETSLRTVDILALREHYSETLRLWRDRFLNRRRTLSHMGFDDVFARMWEFYLAYSEAGFRSGYLNVYQWTFVREALP